ncbi:MAG: hypothetical protein Q9M19_06615 [Mariprofundaceae bacterium]|nr:hypothetical protein [Mariprofundaceae bacterium]
MKEETPGHVMFNADAWPMFDDLVVFWVVVTVLFCIGMIAVLYCWVKKNMDEERKNNEGGANS